MPCSTSAGRSKSWKRFLPSISGTTKEAGSHAACAALRASISSALTTPPGRISFAAVLTLFGPRREPSRRRSSRAPRSLRRAPRGSSRRRSPPRFGADAPLGAFRSGRAGAPSFGCRPPPSCWAFSPPRRPRRPRLPRPFPPCPAPSFFCAAPGRPFCADGFFFPATSAASFFKKPNAICILRKQRAARGRGTPRGGPSCCGGRVGPPTNAVNASRTGSACGHPAGRVSCAPSCGCRGSGSRPS